METKALENIGLSKGEIKVYLALLKLGSTRTGQLSKVAKVSSSKVYKILDRLENKGLAGHILKGEVKYFTATNPERILDYLDEKEKQLNERRKNIERVLPQLKKQFEFPEKKSEAALYVGFKAVTNFFRNILDELKAGDTYYVIGATYGKDEERMRRYFHKHHQIRKDRKINVKMLANYEEKGKLEKTTLLKAGIRYLPHYLIGDMIIYFYKNKVFIALFTKEPKGFLIESEDAVRSFRKYFDMLWNQQSKSFTGWDGMESAFEDILKTLKKGDEYNVFVGAGVSEKIFKRFREFIGDFHKKREEKGINLNIVLNEGNRNDIGADRKKQKFTKVRFVSKEFSSPTVVNAYKNKVMIAIWSDNPTAIVIENDETAKAFGDYFKLIWNMARE